MVTAHIRRMLRVANCLAAWVQDPSYVHCDDALERQVIEIAKEVGPERAAEYAACLARHAAAELDMERLQARDGWPEL